MKSFLALVVVLCAMPARLPAEDWPRFRGPTGQGLSSETQLPQHWNASSNVAWKVEVSGQAWSSPIVWQNRIFLSTATENGTRCHVLCVDAASGRILWDKEVFEQVTRRKEGKNSWATPTPVTDGQRVYAVFG